MDQLWFQIWRLRETPKPTPKPTETPKPTPKPTENPKIERLRKKIEDPNKKIKSNLEKNLKSVGPGAKDKDTGIQSNPAWATFESLEDLFFGDEDN